MPRRSKIILGQPKSFWSGPKCIRFDKLRWFFWIFVEIWYFLVIITNYALSTVKFWLQSWGSKSQGLHSKLKQKCQKWSKSSHSGKNLPKIADLAKIVFIFFSAGPWQHYALYRMRSMVKFWLHSWGSKGQGCQLQPKLDQKCQKRIEN